MNNPAFKSLRDRSKVPCGLAVVPVFVRRLMSVSHMPLGCLPFTGRLKSGGESLSLQWRPFYAARSGVRKCNQEKAAFRPLTP